MKQTVEGTIILKYFWQVFFKKATIILIVILLLSWYGLDTQYITSR